MSRQHRRFAYLTSLPSRAPRVELAVPVETDCKRMIYNIGDTELAPSKNYGKFSSLPIFLGRVSRVSTIDHALTECSFKCYDYSHEVRPMLQSANG